MPQVDKLLFEMDKRGASDLHLSVGHPAMLRLNGEIVHLKMPARRAPSAMAMAVLSLTHKDFAIFPDQHTHSHKRPVFANIYP